MKKKLFSILLAIMLIHVSSNNVYVQAHSDLSRVELDEFTPMYDYVTLITSSISINSLGKSVSSGSVFYGGNYNSTLTIELQRSNGKGWTSVKSWSKSFTGRGNHILEQEYYVASGYTYRVVTTATIKSGTTILETASSTSSEFEY